MLMGDRTFERLQDILHGGPRKPGTFERLQPHHRSESRRLSDCHRPVKAEASKHCRSSGALHEGDLIQVFSQSADEWVKGRVVEFVDGNFVRVEYQVGELWCGKILHLLSKHLAIPSSTVNSSSEESEEHESDVGSERDCDEAQECDPGFMLPSGEALRGYELRIKTATLGKDHTEVACTRHNMGAAYEKQSKYSEALREYEESLRIIVATLGKDHRKVAEIRNNIGLIYDKQSKYRSREE